MLDADDQNPAFYFDKYAAQIPAETGQGVKLQVKVIPVPNLKGQCHEIFCFWFFSSIRPPPPAPEYPIRTISNFFRKFAEIFAAQG